LRAPGPPRRCGAHGLPCGRVVAARGEPSNGREPMTAAMPEAATKLSFTPQLNNCHSWAFASEILYKEEPVKRFWTIAKRNNPPPPTSYFTNFQTRFRKYVVEGAAGLLDSYQDETQKGVSPSPARSSSACVRLAQGPSWSSGKPRVLGSTWHTEQTDS